MEEKKSISEKELICSELELGEERGGDCTIMVAKKIDEEENKFLVSAIQKNPPHKLRFFELLGKDGHKGNVFEFLSSSEIARVCGELLTSKTEKDI